MITLASVTVAIHREKPMCAPRLVQFRIIATADLIDPLAKALRVRPEDVTVTATETVDDPRGFEFGLVEAAAIAGILSAAFSAGSFALALVSFLRDAPVTPEHKVLTLSTAAGSLEICWDEDLDEAEVMRRVGAIFEAH